VWAEINSCTESLELTIKGLERALAVAANVDSCIPEQAYFSIKQGNIRPGDDEKVNWTPENDAQKPEFCIIFRHRNIGKSSMIRITPSGETEDDFRTFGRLVDWFQRDGIKSTKWCDYPLKFVRDDAIASITTLEEFKQHYEHLKTEAIHTASDLPRELAALTLGFLKED